MSSNPDEISTYFPNSCNDCGNDLKDVAGLFHVRKQEVVISPVLVKYVEHQSFSKSCGCGCENIFELPSYLVEPIQ